MGSKWFNLLIIALALLLSAPLHAAWQSALHGTLPGKRLPLLALVPEAGDGVVLVDFWSPGCAPCRDQVPLLNALQATYRTQGLTVIGMAREPPAVLAALAASAGRARPGYVMHSDRGRLFEQLGVQTLPYAVLVDRNGIVAWQGDPSRLSRATIEATLAAPRLGALVRF